MKTCKNCGHHIRKIKGKWMHRMEHPKYDGIGGSGGVTFNKSCFNGFPFCGCKLPEPTDVLDLIRKEYGNSNRF
jgi:hypothetical protein